MEDEFGVSKFAEKEAIGGMAERVSEMKRDALRTGFPIGRKAKQLLSKITRIRPNKVVLHTQVTMWMEVFYYWEREEPVDWEKMAPIDILETKAISESGKGRGELERIAGWFPAEEPRGLLSRFRR